MSQKHSGYARMVRDAYQTPGWVTDVLMTRVLDARLDRLAPKMTVWEPAAGDGQMVERLMAAGLHVVATDIAYHGAAGVDFPASLGFPFAPDPADVAAIITNPPYNQAEAFCRHALALMRAQHHGPQLVAMLLKVDFDSGKTRSDLFGACPAFAEKIVLTDRVHWFAPEWDHAAGRLKAGPSENHAWFIWSGRHRGAPAVTYAAAPAGVLADLAAKRRTLIDRHKPHMDKDIAA